MKKIIQHILKKYNTFYKFSIVGIINTFVDFSIFIFLNKYLGVHYLLSQIFGYTGGVINSFALNKKWTFNNTNNLKKGYVQFIQFIFINIISLIITSSLIKIFVEILYIDVVFSKIIVIFVAQIINFTGSKFLVFSNK
ncbi:GtrA family protein [Defluviitalea phaphyphila]|uniref:GtrA family protein n=1 Tax=Defluviitalea phaphyphila TaxID=1473580 RepID=UPI000731719C